MQVAMSVCYNWDINKRREKDKKHHDLIAALRERHPTGAYIPSLLSLWTGEGTSTETALKGDSPVDSPAPNQDPALSAKVTTGGLSAPVSRWKVGCHLL
jgi:hypothetical protein